MSEPMRFNLSTRLRAGVGASSAVVEFARDQGASRIGVVLDAGLSHNKHAMGLIESLRNSASHLQVVESNVAEPSYDYLDDFRERVEPGLDLLVGVGGGSTLDLAKAVSVLMTNPGPALSYRGFDAITEPGVPLVALPTTAGTGSEVTPNAVFTDRRERRKFGINTELYLPKLAVLDPLLTVSCPQAVTVSAGMDALVHAVESFVAGAATPITRALSREAFRLLLSNLRTVTAHPDDLEARLQMQIAAFFAGSALMNSGAGPAGAASYALGTLHGVPHGLAGAVFLAPVARWNAEHGADVYEGLADLLPQPPLEQDSALRAEAVIAELEALSRAVGVPEHLREFGVGEDDIPDLVSNTMLLEGALVQNPVEVNEAAMAEIVGRLVPQESA